MDSGYSSLMELVEKLQAIQRVVFRMVLQDREGQWSLYTILVDVLPEWLQEGTPCYNYNYGQTAFVAGTVSGGEASKWLLDKAGEIGEYTFRYDLGQDATNKIVYWTRHPSYANVGFSKVAYPTTLYQVRYTSTPHGQPTGFLVGDHCPFFSDFPSAVSRLTYGVTDPSRARDPQEGLFLRFVHREARIKHIEISPTMLSLEVEGSNLIGTQLQISNPPELEVYEHISEAKCVNCPLPNGLPPDVWVVLSRGNDWLDYLYLGQRRSLFRREQDNVTFSPPDIRTQIQELIVQGEGPTTEFKQEIPRDHDRMLKTITAFANGQGGVILLGVEDNSGNVIGITGDVQRMKDDITNMIRNTVYPEPQISIESCDMAGRQVIAIYVDKGTSPPYGLHANRLEFYVRRGATTFPAKQEEIVVLAQSRQQGIWYQS